MVYGLDIAGARDLEETLGVVINCADGKARDRNYALDMLTTPVWGIYR